MPSTGFCIVPRPPSPWHVLDVTCLVILQQTAPTLKQRDGDSRPGQSMNPHAFHSLASCPFVQNNPFIKPLAGISIPTTAAMKTAVGPTFATNAVALTQQQIAQGLNNNFSPLPVSSKSPVNTKHLHKELSAYPDQSFVENLIRSFPAWFFYWLLRPRILKYCT